MKPVKTITRSASILLAAILILALFPVQTATAASDSVTIAQSESVISITNKIQSALDTMAVGETLTVTGSKTGVINEELVFAIPAGVKVVWKATYSGDVSGPTTANNTLIVPIDGPTGGGVLEVASGATITNTSNIGNVITTEDNTSIIVSGGTVESLGSGCAIQFYSGDITITGGTIRSYGDDGCTVSCDNGNIVMTGGKVINSGKSNFGYAAALNSDTGTIVVSGSGEVLASGDGCYAIQSYGGSVAVMGGSVRSTGNNGAAIRVSEDSSGSVPELDYYSVAAYLKGTCYGGVIASPSSIGSGIESFIVEVDTSFSPVRRNGTHEGLTPKTGPVSIAKWDTTGSKHDIVFTLADTTRPPKTVTWGERAYYLNVSNGTGSDDYPANAKVTIQANTAPVGKVFDRWTSAGGGTFANPNSATTTFTMPGNAVTVTANYKASEEAAKANVTKIDRPIKTLWVQSGKSVTVPFVAYSGKTALKIADASLIWKSSRPKVAKVDKDGKITVPKKVKRGTAVITATAASGAKMSVTVKVSSKAIKLNKYKVSAPKSMKVGATKKLGISKVSPAKSTGLKVSFRSSKPGVVSVDRAGNLSAKKAGKAKVTTTINKIRVTKTITVKN